jgi:hypothetical protein
MAEGLRGRRRRGVRCSDTDVLEIIRKDSSELKDDSVDISFFSEDGASTGMTTDEEQVLPNSRSFPSLPSLSRHFSLFVYA